MKYQWALLLVTVIANFADTAFANMPPPELREYPGLSTRYLTPAHTTYRKEVVIYHANWDAVVKPFEQPGTPLRLANWERQGVQQWAQLEQHNLERRKQAVASFFNFYLAPSNNSIRRSWLVDAANNGQTTPAVHQKGRATYYLAHDGHATRVKPSSQNPMDIALSHWIQEAEYTDLPLPEDAPDEIKVEVCIEKDSDLVVSRVVGYTEKVKTRSRWTTGS